MTGATVYGFDANEQLTGHWQIADRLGVYLPGDEPQVPVDLLLANILAAPLIDLAAELVLVALEGMKKPDAEGREFYRLRKYLDSLKRFGSRSRFITWLLPTSS